MHSVQRRDAYGVLVGSPERNKLLGTRKRTRADIIMQLKQTVWKTRTVFTWLRAGDNGRLL